MSRSAMLSETTLLCSGGLVFKLVRHETGLRDFVSFLAQNLVPITLNLAMDGHAIVPIHPPSEWAARLSIVVRGFASALSAD